MLHYGCKMPLKGKQLWLIRNYLCFSIFKRKAKEINYEENLYTFRVQHADGPL